MRRRALLEKVEEAEKLLYKMRETPDEITVLVNHARPKDYELMLQKGICYLRAGDSKGSLLVQKGFERLGYILLHCNGDRAKLFPLSKKRFPNLECREFTCNWILCRKCSILCCNAI